MKFAAPREGVAEQFHHARAAAANAAVVDEAEGALRDALSGSASLDRILLKAAAGAGKSFALRRLVVHAVKHPECSRVAVVAFTNKQTHALAAPLGKKLRKSAVCLFVASARLSEVPQDVVGNVTIATTASEIPPDCKVVIGTCNKLGAFGEKGRQDSGLGVAQNGKTPYDVLFVDEAWQIPHHLFDKVSQYAPITVGVGDVGQLPPLESGVNPWRGDPGYNPFRAWPTDFVSDDRTWTRELPDRLATGGRPSRPVAGVLSGVERRSTA